MSSNQFPWTLLSFVSLIFLSFIPVKAQSNEGSSCNNYWVNPVTAQPECLDLGTSKDSSESEEAKATPNNESPNSSVLVYPPAVMFGPCYYTWQFDLRGMRCGERATTERQRRQRQNPISN